MQEKLILAIDQGTSSTKAIVFDAAAKALARGVEPLHTYYLDNGLVEQEPEDIYQNVLAAVRLCLADLQDKGYQRANIKAIGISNQRETFMLWDKSGKPLHRAIVWQCKRSVNICNELQAAGWSDKINSKTGLVIDPYFSGTKLLWLYRNNDHVRNAIDNGDALFGTVDTWLLFRLTKGQQYATDFTNASRTLLFNLHTLQWDEELLKLFASPKLNMPALQYSAADFGQTDMEGLLPEGADILSMIGDSHAAAFGEACFDAGTAKATLGTGSSILMNIGDRPVESANGMVTTICWSMQGRIDYALEGVIVSCGATIEWLRNALNLFTHSAETQQMAEAVAGNGGVYLVPAFSGLGSPHWQMDRKASITGIHFGTTKNHIVRAALESIGYQINDVIAAMEKDAGLPLQLLRTNGGITANSFVVQWISDLLQKPVAASAMNDVSALGAVYLAGLQAGIFASLDALRLLNTEGKEWLPGNADDAALAYKGWSDAVAGKIC